MQEPNGHIILNEHFVKKWLPFPSVIKEKALTPYLSGPTQKHYLAR